MEESKLRNWLALSNVPNVGPATFKRLVEHFGDIDQIFQSSKDDLISAGCKASLAESLKAPPWNFVDQEIVNAKKRGIFFLTLDDPEYPENLKNISQAPVVLYAQGDLKALSAHSHSIAVVGSRQTSSYGVENCRNFVRGLVAQEITIVSGFARGIDIAAHLTAIDCGGNTIAVLGSGLGNIYPSENQKYVEKLLKSGGLILSEFPYNTEARPEFFPRRNRVVSGLSRGVLVIECAEKSGALITANYAAEQGRDVFAVPGPIHSLLARGPHKLIGQGAKLVQSPQDILDEWQIVNTTEKKKDGSVTTSTRKTTQLPPHWQPIYVFCQNEGRIPDEICAKTGLASSDLLAILTQMEIAGHLKRLPGNRYLTV